MTTIAIGIHGGCGTLERSLLSEAEWAESHEHLAQALRAGWRVLKDGGAAVDAVTAAVVVMEDSPHFNAGYGAALNGDGDHELEASIMDGSDFNGGAVCAARRIRNPVLAARALMRQQSPLPTLMALCLQASPRVMARSIFCALISMSPGAGPTSAAMKS